MGAGKARCSRGRTEAGSFFWESPSQVSGFNSTARVKYGKGRIAGLDLLKPLIYAGWHGGVLPGAEIQYREFLDTIS